MLNYVEIGNRIRNCRRAAGLSQEQLAERADISPTHMSHIETGGTKLSLSVLVLIAQALETSVDELLFDRRTLTASSAQIEIEGILARCSAEELRFMAQIINSTKKALDDYR